MTVPGALDRHRLLYQVCPSVVRAFRVPRMFPSVRGYTQSAGGARDHACGMPRAGVAVAGLPRAAPRRVATTRVATASLSPNSLLTEEGVVDARKLSLLLEACSCHNLELDRLPARHASDRPFCHSGGAIAASVDASGTTVQQRLPRTSVLIDCLSGGSRVQAGLVTSRSISRPGRGGNQLLRELRCRTLLSLPCRSGVCV